MTDSLFQLLPALSDEEFAALKADIRARGVMVPVEYDEAGNVLDGHHRLRAVAELATEGLVVDCGARVLAFESDKAKRAHVLSINLQRRQLSQEQKREIAGRLFEEAEFSREEIARLLAVSHEAVRLWTQAATSKNLEVAPPRRTGRDGKSRPTRYKPRIVVTQTRRRGGSDALQRLLDVTTAALGAGVEGEVTEGKAGQEARRHEREQAVREDVQASEHQPVVQIASAVEWLTTTAPRADLLLTDPPYSTDVPNIEGFAREWLPPALSCVKPTGRAYVCIGAYPRELRAYLTVEPPPHLALTQVLVWEYTNTLGPKPAREYHLNWQAILYYVGQDAPPLDEDALVRRTAVHNLAAPRGSEPHYHAWQKPMELGERFVRQATTLDALVIDPFAGTGTFLLAAARCGRLALGCERDTAMARIAVERGCVCHDL